MNESELKLLDVDKDTVITIEESYKKSKIVFDNRNYLSDYSYDIYLSVTHLSVVGGYSKNDENQASGDKGSVIGFEFLEGHSRIKYNRGSIAPFGTVAIFDSKDELSAWPRDSLIHTQITTISNDEIISPNCPGEYWFGGGDSSDIFLFLRLQPVVFNNIVSAFKKDEFSRLQVSLSTEKRPGIYFSDLEVEHVRILFEDNIENIQGEFPPEAREKCFYEGWKNPAEITDIRFSSGLKKLNSSILQKPIEPTDDYSRVNLTISDVVNLIDQKKIGFMADINKAIYIVFGIFVIYAIIDYFFGG
jgi:hypothetical protein